MVDDTTKRDGGKQRLVIDDVEIKLDFDNNKTLSFIIRIPTSLELLILKNNWICPPPLKCNPLKHVKTWRAPGKCVQTEAPWSSRMACASKLTIVKTHENTTQLCSSQVEMDNRESPRQHRKTRLLPLQPRRIP